uniref:Polycystin cation channel PKD1/PKD2 domain-containing protein n=1 Tax=Stomoxys calcitrans TaxID=35570 RepID=A0A1I8P7Z4_STOCA
MFIPRFLLGKYKNKLKHPNVLRRKSDAIKYDSDEAVKEALCEILTYSVFLIASTIVANASHHLYMFYFNQTLKKLFIGREMETKFGMEVRFEEIVTTLDLWNFLETKFLDDLHGETFTAYRNNEPTRTRKEKTKSFNITEEGYGLNDDQRRLVLRDNILLGPPRLRQIRVKENSCHVNEAFLRYFNSCYREYSYNSEDRRPFFKKILAEMPPVGGLVTSYQFQALKLHSIWSDFDYGVSAASGIFYLMVLHYTFEELGEFISVGLANYFKSMWNLIDITVLLFSYISFAYNIIHPIYMKKIVQKSNNDPNTFWSIDKICFWNLLYVDMMAVCVFLVWIKIFKYISINKTMLQFSITLKKCAKDLFGFAVMFFIVFLAYAQLGLLIFGTSHPDFRSFGISVVTLMRMFLGDFEYELIEKSNHILGPIYFLSYVLFVFFILLNMFLAIINDTYGAVKSEVNSGHSHFGPYLAKLFRYIFCSGCKSHETTVLKSRKRQMQSSGDFQINWNDFAEVNSISGDSFTNGNISPTGGRLRMHVHELIREILWYFQELSDSEYKLHNVSENPKDNYDLRSLTNRITRLEEVLEQLIANMDQILKFQTKQQMKNKK